MFYKFIRVLISNYKHKKKFFKYKLTKNDKTLIKCFIKYNIIKYYTIKFDNSLIFLKYFNNEPLFKIKNMYKPSAIKYITIKELKKNTFFKNKIYFISSSEGIISNIDAIKKNKGGVIICKLYL